MIGLPDPWIVAAYLLCILSSILCIVYGLLRWNQEDPVNPTPPQREPSDAGADTASGHPSVPK